MTMRRVIIESPFRGDRATNLAYMRDVARYLMGRGDAPLASHALYTQWLDDDVAGERALGIECGLVWGAAAELTVVAVDLGLSTGMRIGLERARAEGRRVEWLSLLSWSGDSSDADALMREAVRLGDAVTVADPEYGSAHKHLDERAYVP